jgi:hypothetical protein
VKEARAVRRRELWGGMTSCSKDELLWTSPTIGNFDTWATYCGTLMASRDYPYLVVAATSTTAAGAYVTVDNFR